nr:PREDICTED: lisH domain-containing protein FOPNL [Opisthocomus hoazin]
MHPAGGPEPPRKHSALCNSSWSGFHSLKASRSSNILLRKLLELCRNYVYIADDECCLNTFGFISSDLFMVIVLKDTLEKRGALGEIKARIRAEVFNALEDRSEPRPPLSHENLLINELIREYLEYNKYKYTSSVLTAESGQPEVPLDRQFLAKELNIVEDANGKSVPLLYGIISHFLHGGREESTQNTHPKVSLLKYPKQNLGKLPAERNQKDGIPEPGRMAGMSIAEPLVLQSINR